MVREVYRHLPMLKDVLAWQYSSRWTLSVGRAVVADRFTRIVRPFFGDRIPALRSLMHDWGAVITGSCALDMLTGQNRATNDLNLVVPHGGFDIMDDFIVRSEKFERDNKASRPHQAFRSVVETFARYRSTGVRITLSEAMSEDIFEVITSSPTTGDMIFMTPGGVVAFYPELTFDNNIVLNGPLRDVSQSTYVGCMKHARYRTYMDTSFLHQSCGTLCPALWRNIADGGPGALVFEWDSRYSFRSSLGRSQTSWRIAERCQNTACPLNSINDARQPLLPANPAPADRTAVREQEARMRHHLPVRTRDSRHRTWLT